MKLNCILGLPIHSVAIPAVMGLHSDHGVDGCLLQPQTLGIVLGARGRFLLQIQAFKDTGACSSSELMGNAGPKGPALLQRDSSRRCC